MNIFFKTSTLFYFRSPCFYPSLKKVKLLALQLEIANCFSMDICAVTREFEKFAPLKFSEPWDNVGLLTSPTYQKDISTILFTNDLTEVVLDEALSRQADMIFSYHPPIFTSIKSLKNSKWKDRIILKCIENGIAIYSPHTALDAAREGVNNWLISCFELESSAPLTQSFDHLGPFQYQVDCNILSSYALEKITSIPDLHLAVVSSNEVSCFVKILVSESSLSKLMTLLTKDHAIFVALSKCHAPPLPNFGMGRIGKLKSPLTIKNAISTIKQFLDLPHVRVSFGKHHTLDTEISSVAVCAGSGSSVLRDSKAELYVTGEMSHHDLLDAAHKGATVILCEHSNSERGFLKELAERLKPILQGVKLIISKLDKDPVEIL